jgi:hypothetical protein
MQHVSAVHCRFNFQVTVIIKSCQTTRHEGAWEERRYNSYSVSTSALDGSEWSASRPGRALAPGKGSLVPIVQEAGWAPDPVWTQARERILPLLESQITRPHRDLMIPRNIVKHCPRNSIGRQSCVYQARCQLLCLRVNHVLRYSGRNTTASLGNVTLRG